MSNHIITIQLSDLELITLDGILKSKLSELRRELESLTDDDFDYNKAQQEVIMKIHTEIGDKAEKLIQKALEKPF